MPWKTWLAFVISASLNVSPALSHEVRLPTRFSDMELIAVAEDVFVAHGLEAPPTAANHGFMSNSGVLLTDAGVVIVDTGGSREVAAALLGLIGDLTDEPVIAVFNTHVHGDHWLGNAEIRAAYPDVPIYAHYMAVKRLREDEASAWARIMTGLTGQSAAVGDVLAPTHGVRGDESFTIGGRALNLHHTGHAHTDSDIMLELPDARVLFTGDIVEFGRAVSSDVPADFSALGQIAAIEYALELDVDIFVPGHGPSGGEEVPRAALDFLRILYESVSRGYEQGMQGYEMRDAVAEELAAYSDWVNFDDLGRLISYTFLQAEDASFD